MFVNFYINMKNMQVKAKFHYAVLIADRSEAGRRPASLCC